MPQVGMIHNAEQCDEPADKTRRLVTCRYCKTPDLVWHKCSLLTGYRLYEPLSKMGMTKADTTKPHRCSTALREKAEVNEDRIREIVAELMSDLNTNGNVTINVDEDRIRELVTDTLGEYDVESIRDMLKELVADLELPVKRTVLELQIEGREKVTIEGTHKQSPELLYWMNARDVSGFRHNTMLFGKPGVSKSHTTAQLAKSLGLSFGLISLNPQTPESRVFGYMDAGGTYHRTLFREAFENGGVFLIDEIDNASDALLTSLNSCLANAHGAFPDGMVARHPDFVCVATANTPGRGGDRNHAGRRPLDAATLNRFVVIEWKNDDDLEASLVMKVNDETGMVWLRWIRDVRAYCDAHHPRVVVSPRTSMMGAKALKDSPFTPEQIADMTLFKGLDKDTRSKILTACPLPVRS